MWALFGPPIELCLDAQNHGENLIIFYQGMKKRAWKLEVSYHVKDVNFRHKDTQIHPYTMLWFDSLSHFKLTFLWH